MLSQGGACLKDLPSMRSYLEALAEHAQLTILKSPPEKKVGTQKLLKKKGELHLFIVFTLWLYPPCKKKITDISIICISHHVVQKVQYKINIPCMLNCNKLAYPVSVHPLSKAYMLQVTTMLQACNSVS